MSVEQLQAHIDNLSADIRRQKEVLKQLEQSKSSAQRQLNALRDPVARLPLEISSQIFLRCVPPGNPSPASDTAPMLFMNVCNAWTDIALSTPSLWAAMRLDFSGAQILNIWFQRARNYSLSVSFHQCLDWDLAFTLSTYSQQLKRLEIEDKNLYPSLTEPALSCLETLEINGVTQDDENFACFSFPHIIGLLRLAPNLVECTLEQVSWESVDTSQEKLVLPRLRSLKLCSYIRHIGSDDDILDHLSLPALETLALSFDTISSTEFSFFMERSLPPLQNLIMGGGRTGFDFIELGEWLRLVPSLLRLELCTRDPTCVHGLFSAFADSPHFLPNLRDLVIFQESHPFSEASYQLILRALSARCTQITGVELKTLYSRSPKPSEGVCDGLRQFAAEGMEIYVGTDASNLLSS